MKSDDPTGSSQPTPNENPRRKNLIPTQEDKLSSLAQRVAVAWKDSPLTLLWKTAADLEKEVLAYETLLQQKAMATGNRRPITQTLQEQEAELKEATTELKAFLQYTKKTKQAKAYFEMFGLTKEGTLPTNQKKRVQSLHLLIDSLSKEATEPHTYGKAFWQSALQRYKTKLEEADTADKTINEHVQEKKVLNKEITRVLRSLVKLIEANYPDHHKDMLQKWGF